MPDKLQGPHPPRGSSETWPFAIARAAAAVRGRTAAKAKTHAAKTPPGKRRPPPATHAG